MKPGKLKTARLLLSLLIITVTVGLVSWDHKQSPNRTQQTFTDTVPKSKADKKVRNIDEALEELNNGEWKAELEKAMKELNKGEWQAELEKGMKELRESMKSFDGEKLKLELDKAMREVDLGKIQKEFQESLSKIDFNKIKEEMNQAFKEIDLSKIQLELKESLDKVDWDKIKLDMEKVRDVDMKKLEIDMQNLREEMKELKPKMEKELSKAKIDLDKAKEELKEYKNFVDGLEKDGLIEKDKYSLKHESGELLINGKKASDQTYNKYRNFLDKHKRFTIDKRNDHFNIDTD